MPIPHPLISVGDLLMTPYFQLELFLTPLAIGFGYKRRINRDDFTGPILPLMPYPNLGLLF